MLTTNDRLRSETKEETSSTCDCRHLLLGK